MSKAQLRRHYLRWRKALASDVYRSASGRAQQRLGASEPFLRANCIGLYSSIANEVGTRDLFELARTAGKRTCYPLVKDRHMDFCFVDDLSELQRGSFGIEEPDSGPAVDGCCIDLIVLPGVAFDRRGRRLGYGQGYYDRYIASLQTRPVTVGLCFEGQLHDGLPHENHDCFVDWIATESEIIPCQWNAAGSV